MGYNVLIVVWCVVGGLVFLFFVMCCGVLLGVMDYLDIW